jgi:outer membrane protein TolC
MKNTFPIPRLIITFALFMNPCGATSQATVTQDSKLSLSQYLDQVKTGNRTFIGSATSVEGAKLRTDEGSLLTKPALFGSAQYLEDKRETGSPQGDQLSVTSYTLGLRQQTDFGLEAKLTYNQSRTSLPGANPTVVPLSEYYATGPVFELTQSLGRNGFGAETRATKELLSASAKATEFGESFKQKQILAQAESAYWRLAVAREAVNATNETVDRSEKIKKWSSQRAQLNLGNRSDFLQTEAAFLGRSLEYQAALDEEKNASRAFNTIRGIDLEVVTEQILVLDEKVIKQLSVPERSEYREDVKAAEQQKRLAQANSRIGLEKNKPDVKVFGAYGMNGRDASAGEAMKEANTADHPNYIVGVRLDIPLDIGTQSDVRQGYRKDEQAADLNYQQKVFEQERLWKDLTNQFNDSLKRYQMAKIIEKALRESMEFERTRHRRGLTTTFQVLQFEQNFANAQLARLRSQADVLNIYSQLKTFGGGQP